MARDLRVRDKSQAVQEELRLAVSVVFSHLSDYGASIFATICYREGFLYHCDCGFSVCVTEQRCPNCDKPAWKE